MDDGEREPLSTQDRLLVIGLVGFLVAWGALAWVGLVHLVRGCAR